MSPDKLSSFSPQLYWDQFCPIERVPGANTVSIAIPEMVDLSGHQQSHEDN